MEDTLTSTIGTVVQADQYKNAKDQKSKSENWTDSRSVPNGASGMDYGYGHMVEGNESYSESASNITNESGAHSSSFQNTSGNSSHSRARMSPTPSSSILSSASSVSGSRSRMSPKSLKNTVHFHSLVTEISTSASQSYEDKISYRKLDITPKNSENFEDDHDVMENESRENPNKENEYMPPDEESPDEHYSSEGTRRGARGQQVWNVYTASLPPGPIGENHPAVMKSSGKSDITDTAMMKSGGRSDISDIVKELGKDSQDKVLQEKLMKTNVENDSQYYYGTASTDLGRYMHAKTADDSITSMQEEITRSYLFSQQGLKSQKDGVFEIVKPSINVFEGSEVDFDESAVHLQPVILNGVQNSLHENRSMLEDEEKIRSNLQRVLFEDSDSEVSEVSDNDDDDDKIKSVEDQFEKKETDGKDQHGDVVNGDIVENEHASKSDESGIIAAYEQWTDLSNDKNDVDIIPNEHIQRNENEFDDADQDESDGEKSVDEKTAEVHEISESENEDDLGHDDDNNVDEEESISEDEDNETGEKEQVHNESNENNGETDFEVVDIQEEIDEETELKKPFQELNYTENTQPAVQVNEIDEQENEAKADHIQKYLSQVHEHSLHHEEEEEDEGMLETEGGKSEDIMNSISGLIQTFTSTIQSMNHLSQEDLFKMQAEQFELIQKKMIEHQQAQLEELFVAQRREQMNLQKEMENYHTHITEKQMSIDLMTLPPTMVPQISDSLPQVTNARQPPTYGQTPAVRQQNTSQASTMSSPPFPVRPVAAYQPANAAQNSNLGFASTYNTMPYPDTMAFIDPRGFMQANIDPRAGVGGVGMGMGLPMGFPQLHHKI
ncbi:hypothetical protein MAR_029314 [Mya arenaria]|uniref:Uncharacterized protein n=1 Tax=Mya arenaria TaxID=6604 RepID=A0ABY7DH43_MYAAR|nr:hypothetical protein MAR_029314 [Mya arenaria]